MKAVILAGGKGKRLEPYSTVLPKPLMPVGDMPIMEILIRQLKRAGFDDIYIACGHLAELIKSYFNDGKKWGVNITYSVEDKELGTVGPLKLLKKELDEPFITVNGDILTDMNFRDIFRYHIIHGGPMTLGVTKRQVYVDFGVIELDENTVKNYKEKPVLEYYVSMGVYVFTPYVIRIIPEDKKFDIPDLVDLLMSQNLKVFTYYYEGFWLDIGRKEDAILAQEEFEKRKKEILGE
ncbi:MAG: NTP transferase domain-containing protein [Candidatus Hydrothermae bacterium]|nr:NTP transferase domain-containing protein [Candidatus Hydrothermae bacterium]